MNYDTPNSRAGRAIRVLLAERGESIEALSDGTGISNSTLKRRLLGATSFTIDELGLVAQYFDVPLTHVVVSPAEREAQAAAVLA
ncbi:helix-turn-helix transcriptional regulator [Rathayibacter sp. AY1B8]|uniref:helix-turn-helix domain-containing protein n=1 Tax=Rathayibacter sp. AY1B8 TaxID=2080533 RepID=UPI000CE743D0|nr:helix-turn-helix transcriptional regulator [Rathayibacter sp. AY1B8]PPI08214.1 hypothetical protein C5C63_04475 [Rathayibacter sp. AY1B8]